MHATEDGLVLAALVDGRVMVYNMENKTRFFFKSNETCSDRHSEIVAMCSLFKPKLLLMGFACGKLHVYKWQKSLKDYLLSHHDHHCTQLASNLSIHSLIGLHAPSISGNSVDILSVWFGTSSSTVVIWEYSLIPDLYWGLHNDIEKVESVVSVCAEELVSTSNVFTAKTLMLSSDKSCVVALLHQRGSQVSSFAVIDVATKTLLHYITCKDMEGLL